MLRIRPLPAALAALLAVGLLAACEPAGSSELPAERQQSRVAYEERLDQVPDAVLATMDPLDSLFLDHDLAAFALPPPDTAGLARWVDSTLARLTLDEKIGQLFIVHLPPPSGLRQALDDAAVEAVEVHHVGGFLVPRLLGPEAVFEATQRLQGLSNVPLFFAADYERGVGRFDNALTELPSNMALGATRDTVLAAAAGRLTAIESRAIGVNLLLAPVVDVNNNPDNPIINIRSYGEDPELVARMADAFVREAQRYGVLTTLKHFPGHGNTSVDSHARLGTVAGTAAALDSIELKPYRRLLGGPEAPAGVMSAHLWVPAVDDQPLPATFSPRVLTDLLRDSLGFEGFVVTDDIRMGALQQRFEPDERIIRPLQAGADIILTPRSLSRARLAIRAALNDGTLTRDDLDRSVRRILTAKARAGLHRDRYADEAALDALLDKPRGAYLAQLIADRALTLLKTDSTLLPLRPEQRLALVQMRNVRESESIQAAQNRLAEALGADDDLQLGVKPTADEERAALAAAREADVVVLALYLRLQAGRGEAGLFEGQQRLARRLLDAGQPVVLVTFGNPYAVVPFGTADVLLVAYEQSIESVAAAAAILTGTQAPRGRLPITVEPYAFGSGLQP